MDGEGTGVVAAQAPAGAAAVGHRFGAWDHGAAAAQPRRGAWQGDGELAMGLADWLLRGGHRVLRTAESCCKK